MTNRDREGLSSVAERMLLSRLTLATLLNNPESFASLVHETGVGSFTTISGSVALTPVAPIGTVAIRNPNYYVTLPIKLTVQATSTIVQVQLIKDEVSVINIAAFTDFNEIVPTFFTPIRNVGSLTFTNLSVVSSPSAAYYLQLIQMRTNVWAIFKGLLAGVVQDALQVRTPQ